MKHKFYNQSVTFVIIIVLSLALVGCGSSVKIGPRQTVKVEAPITAAQGEGYNLTLQARTASIDFDTSSNQFLEGNLNYNVPEIKPVVVTEGNQTRITEPAVAGELPEDVKNDWRLKLNKEVPLNLNFEAGTYSGSYNLGGLSLKTLNFKQGGENTRLYFSEQNKIDLEEMTVETVSSKLYLTGLSNARLRKATIICRNGNLTLDFFKANGELDQPIENVLVKGEAANLTIYTLPIPAEIILDKGDPAAVSASYWTKSGNTFRNSYWNRAGAGEPKLTIHVELTDGHLFLF